MISKILLTGLLTLFLSGGIMEIAENVDGGHETISVVTDDITKAIEFNGEVIPWIELPTVEITGSIDSVDLVEAIIVDGEVYPSYHLEEVVIIPGT